MIGSNRQPVSRTTDSVIRTMFLSLLPFQFLATVSGSLGSIVNTFLVGNHLSAAALGALGFTSLMSAILVAVSTTVSAGARILCGKSMGRGDIEEQQRIYSSSVFVLTLFGILFFALGFFLSESVAALFGAGGDLLEPTAQYIRGMAPGFFPSLMVPCLLVFQQMNNDSNFSVISAVMLAGFSLLFGLINLRWMEGTMLGMGLADALAKWLTFLIIMLRNAIKKVQKASLRFLAPRAVLNMLWIGLPSALSGLFYSIRNINLNRIGLESIGKESTAALSILISSMGPLDAINASVGTVCLMICSLYIGMKDQSGSKTAIRLTVRIGLIIGFVKLIVTVIAARPIACFFGASGSLTDMTVRLIRLYSLTMPLNIITIAFVSPFQCLGKVKLVNIVYLFSAIIIPVGFAALTLPIFGMDAINLCFFVAELLTVIFFYVYGLCRGCKSMRVEELVDLPREEGVYQNFSVTTTADAVAASKTVREFCEQNGIDKRRSYYCGLCVEELAVNSVEHGFSKTPRRRNLSVDIFLHIFEGTLQLRICDNCIHFNPLDHVTPKNEREKEKYMGIRLVRDVADEITYQSAFGQNVISISWKNHSEKPD